MVDFIRGLRATPLDQLPVFRVRTSNGEIVVVDEEGVSATSELVASDDRYDLHVVRHGGRTCTWLRPTSPLHKLQPDCTTDNRLTGTTSVFQMEDLGDGIVTIAAWIDDPTATEVRVTSPTGESAVVPTGGETENLVGQFAMAHLTWGDAEWDQFGALRDEDFTIEVVAPDQ